MAASFAAKSGLPCIALVAVGEGELVLEGSVLFAEKLNRRAIDATLERAARRFER